MNWASNEPADSSVPVCSYNFWGQECEYVVRDHGYMLKSTHGSNYLDRPGQWKADEHESDIKFCMCEAPKWIAPTPIPTTACPSGEYLDGDVGCTSCLPGMYECFSTFSGTALSISNHSRTLQHTRTGLRAMTTIHLNLPKPGTSKGAPSNEACDVCGPGQIATEMGSVSCRRCPVGKYNDKAGARDTDKYDHDEEEDCLPCMVSQEVW